MIFDRELLGRFGQHAWRPSLLGWGLGLPLVALAWVIVFRIATGAASMTDLAALAGVLLPFMRYLFERGQSSSVGQGPRYSEPPEGRIERAPA